MSTSEELTTKIKNTNNMRSMQLLRRNIDVRKLYYAAYKEYKNTVFFKYVRHLFILNLRQTIYLRRRHPYITRMYNALINAKKANQEQEVAQTSTKPQTNNTAQKVEKKAAVLIGINYKGSQYQLNGCENDIINTKKILLSQYGFKEQDIIMLTESFGEKPTRANILKHMQNLVNKSNQGYTSLWFQYSGHGTYTTDYNGDEKDKKDECIVTSDMNLITDDEFRTLFTSRINKNTKMFCLMDCCHSGTIMDLKYKYTSETKQWTTESKYNVGANIFSISGCRDDQTSADAWMNGNWTGALTACFIKALVASSYKPNIFSLLNTTRDLLRANQFTQIPQLTSTMQLSNNDSFTL